MTQTLSFVTGTGTIQVANMLQASLAMNIRAIVEADAAIEAAKERKARAVEAINSTHGRGKHTVPGYGEVTISANNTYDAYVMRDGLTDWQFERRASKRVLDNAKVKANFPDLYESAKVERGVKASARVY